MTNSSVVRMGYLVSTYPAVSHTFILREVTALRQRGIFIDVASINDCGDRAVMTELERVEASKTFYVKNAGAIGALYAFFQLSIKNPLGMVRGLLSCLRLGQTDVRKIVLCLFYFAEAAILARWMSKQKLTHLHVHFATPAATVALILTQIAPVSYSMTVHGPDEFYDVSSYYMTEKIEAAQFVVCISFFARSQLMKLSLPSQWSKLEIGRLGIDTNHFSPRPFRQAPEVFEVLCVGRLVPAKGQGILIQAAALLAQHKNNFVVRFVGDGPDRRELEKMASSLGISHLVRFEGSLNQDKIQDFFKQADIFALASFAEGIPVVLMEAMAMEIPCVSTAINGIPELIDDGINGFLVFPSDIEGLATTLNRLMDDPTLRESIGKAARERVLSQYEISASANRLASIFTQHLG